MMARSTCRGRAVLDQHDSVGQHQRFGDVMGDEHRGELLLEPDALDQPLHADAGQRIERTQGLIESEQARPADERACQRDALLLPA